MSTHLDPNRRHDFVFLFDVTDGNPNGDPDAGNLPRVDPETMQGLVTDVSIKRKIRNFVDAAKGNEERFKIYVQNRGILNEQHRKAYGSDEEPVGKKPRNKKERQRVDEARTWMCQNFYDIRTFGAVMSTSVNAGQVRGPVQLTFSRSIDPVIPQDVTITRVAVTKEEDAYQQEGETDGGKETEMGRKALIPYGLYRGHGFFSPMLAKDTGFDDKDLALLWQALQMGFDLDRSASRGLMALRGLYVFSHEKKLGNAPAHTLFDRIAVARKNGNVARAFSDYEVKIEDGKPPKGVKFTRVVG